MFIVSENLTYKSQLLLKLRAVELTCFISFFRFFRFRLGHLYKRRRLQKTRQCIFLKANTKTSVW